MLQVIGYILLGLLGMLLLVLILPAFLTFSFHTDLRVTLWVLGIPFPLYRPDREKAAKTESNGKEAKKQTKKPSRLSGLACGLKERGVQETVRLVRKLADLAVGTARDLLNALTVDKLSLSLYIASADAARTAIDTGRVCAVLYPALTALQQVIRIRHRAVTVTPDYLAERGRCEADIRIHARPIRVLLTAARVVPAIRGLNMQMKNLKEEENDGK